MPQNLYIKIFTDMTVVKLLTVTRNARRVDFIFAA